MKLNNSLYQTKFLELKSTKSPNGQSDWIYAHRPNTKQSQSDAVVIAPIIHENDGDSILFLETRQYFGISQNRIDDKQTGTE